MLKNEIFLKEISKFLRSCTIKNKYFAQMTANQVMDKYELDSLPDYFNPYYLHMFGLSTLDLAIPDYLIDDNGNRVINEDRRFKVIVGDEPEFVHTMLIRLDHLDNSQIAEKVNIGINTVKNSLCKVYLNEMGYEQDPNDEVPVNFEIWDLTGVTHKVLEVKNRLENYTPKDDRTAVDLIVGGSYDWADLVEYSPVYNGTGNLTITNLSELYNLTEIEVGDYIHCTSDQKTFRYAGIDSITGDKVFNRVNVNEMFNDTVGVLKAERANGTNLNLDIYINLDKPDVVALMIIGDLDWEAMYNSYSTLATIDDEYHPKSALDDLGNPTDESITHKGLVIDTDFENISDTLGYSNVDLPEVGTRINYRNFNRAWKISTDIHGEITVYTKSIPTNGNLGEEIFFSDRKCTEKFGMIYNDPLSDPVTLNSLEETSNGPILHIYAWLDEPGGASQPYTVKRDPDNDYLVKQGTFQFNGLTWSEVSLRSLFEDELKERWMETFGSRIRGVDYITMQDNKDKDSFDEKLIWTPETGLDLDDTKVYLLDRWEYTGWDKPVYIPTYDHYNSLTNDLTLYIRLHNRIRDNNIKTTLKYFIGADVYNDACEEYPTMMDFIKGVFYPVINCSENQLNWIYAYSNGLPIKVAMEEDYNDYTSKLRLKLAKAYDETQAPNFKLLNYDSTLLQEQEAESIVDAVRKTLSICRERFDVHEFGYEELYYAAMWAVIWQHLPIAILTQRIKNLRTEAVHVDHIWEYLNGKGLKDYRTVLDLDQQVYLYKNIDYLQGNEGKQSTLKILSDKLLKRFSAEIRTKSVLLDTTSMKCEMVNEEESVLLTHLINGLKESVSGKVRMLSEDLDEGTAVISQTTGRIEDFDDIYLREYESGLEPKYGVNATEQATRIEEAHNEIEFKKHSYAPTKLAEITRGKVMEDMTRISMSFMLQTFLRKLSGEEIGNNCVVNVQFEGLGQTKTFTAGECLALIFYALRKEMWYSFYDKYGKQVFSKNGIWKDLVTFNATGDASQISSSKQLGLVGGLPTFSNCSKTLDPTVESDCDHSDYDPNEKFIDVIPNEASLWLPYLGNYKNIDGEMVRVGLPYSVDGLDELVGDPTIYLRGELIGQRPSYRNLMQVTSPYQYNSIELQSWNDMCYAEDTINPNARSFTVVENIGSIFETRREFNMPEGVIQKYDACLGRDVYERLRFREVDTSIGGIVTGTDTTGNNAWVVKGVDFPETRVNSHTELINHLNKQVSSYLKHFLMVRASADYYFHQAVQLIYDAIRVNDTVTFELVPGYTTYSDWFDNDGELKSAFRAIEEGSNQKSVYASVASSLISSLFPEDKISSSSGIDIAKYNTIKQLLQQMCSYNIAFLNTASLSYECLFTHPITFNTKRENGKNIRYLMRSMLYYYGTRDPEQMKYIGGSYRPLKDHILYGIPLYFSAVIRFYPRFFMEGRELQFSHENRVTVDKIILRSIYSKFLEKCNADDEGAFLWTPESGIYVHWITIPNYNVTNVLSMAYSEEDGTNYVATDHTAMFKITADNLSMWRRAVNGEIVPRWVCDGVEDENDPTNMTYTNFEYREVTAEDIGKYTTKYYYQMKLKQVEESISSSHSWKSNSYVYEPTTDLTFQDGVTYYTKEGVIYSQAKVTVGDPIPFNNQNTSEKVINPKIYDVLGSKVETTIYYIRRAVNP